MNKMDRMKGGAGRMKRFAVWGLILLWMTPAVFAASPAKSTVFQDANTSYRTGDYETAAKLYEILLELQPEAPVLYYNLANAQVRLGKLSHAILNYSKALRLDPRNADVRENLRYARGLREYRAEDTRNWYLKATEAVLKYVTEREVYTVVLAVLFIFLLRGIFFFVSGRGVFWCSWQKFLFFLLLLTALVAFGKHVQSDLIREAIVMQKECEARYGPSEHDQVAFRMGEGIRVFVMDRREDWSRVLLTNGESGWVKDADISEVTV